MIDIIALTPSILDGYTGKLILHPAPETLERYKRLMLAKEKVRSSLDAMRGASPVFLVPCTAAALIQQCYAWGARNVELHAAQSLGPVPPARGLSFPTFLPESG